MPRAELVDDRIELTGVSHRDRYAVGEIPGGRYRDGVWSCPVAWAPMVVMRRLLGDRLEVGDDLKAWAWREYGDRVQPATEARELAMDPGEDIYGYHLESLLARLYPFQRTGVGFLLASKGAALTDDMGVGKTVQTIAMLEEGGRYPALIVAPKTAKPTWLREFAKWAPQRDAVIVGGSAAKRRKTLAEDHDAYIINWEALRLHSRLAPYGSVRLEVKEREPKELNRPWGAVIADEAHRAIKPKAKQTRALWAVGAEAGVRVPLTGTPIADTPADFWSLLHFVTPREWPSRTKYVDRYCQTVWNAFGGLDVLGLKPETADEFHSLVAPRLLRRPKELVLPWLPEKVRERRDVEMAPRQAAAYKQFEKDMVADLDGGLGMALDQLSVLTRLTQLASASLRLEEDGSIRMCAPSSKVDALVELLEDMGEEPLVVYAQSRQLIDLAAERLAHEKIEHRLIVGGQTELVRSMAETDFADGLARVLLLTMGAGSESITLTRASTTCFMQRSWSLIENRQAENRMDRHGQKAEKITIIDLVAPDTIEEDQHDAVAGKGERLEEILRDRAALREALLRRGK